MSDQYSTSKNRYIEVITLESSDEAFPDAFHSNEDWNIRKSKRWLDVKYLSENATIIYFKRLLTIIKEESLDYIASKYENHFVDWIISFYIAYLRLSQTLHNKPKSYQKCVYPPDILIQIPLSDMEDIVEIDEKNIIIDKVYSNLMWVNVSNLFNNPTTITDDKILDLIKIFDWCGIELILREIKSWHNSELVYTIINIRFLLMYYIHIYKNICNMFGYVNYPNNKEPFIGTLNPNEFCLDLYVLYNTRKTLASLTAEFAESIPNTQQMEDCIITKNLF